jgi:hypothetical protein
MGEREGGKKKCPLHSTLKRVKVFFFLKKRDEKGKKDKNQKITFL